MSMRRRKVLLRSSLLLPIAALMLISARGVLGKAQHDRYRTIVVTAKDMVYDQTEIRVAPGEWVRLILRNEDPGMKHDLVIEGLGVRTTIIKTGERTEVIFQVPAQGSFTFLCSLHPVTMRGLLIVETPVAGSRQTRRSS